MSDKTANDKAANDKPVDNAKLAAEIEAKVMAKVSELLAAKNDEIESLKEKVRSPYEDRSSEGGNPKVMLYKPNNVSMQFFPEDVESAKKDGWKETPVGLKGHVAAVPKPAMGEIVEGKPHLG